MKKKEKIKGYTLIELLLVLALRGVVSVPIMISFTGGLRIYNREISSIESVDLLRKFTYDFNQTIRSSTFGEVKIIDGNLSVKGNQYYLSNDSVVVKFSDETEKTLLDKVLDFKVINVIEKNGDVKKFTLIIEVEDSNESFTTTTTYTIRGD